MAYTASAQTYTKDAQGNYTQVKSDTTKGKTSAKPTGKTFTDLKGVRYPIFISKNGKLFYIRVAKTSGKPYNVYIK